MEHSRHSTRLALLLAFAVVALVVVAVDHFASTDNSAPQQAAVLRAYAR
jgi:hypothetical protein